MHTSYSFTHILICIHSFIPEHICSHMQTYSMCVRTDIHAYIQTCMQAHRHTSIPAYSHAGIHMQVCRDMCLQMRFCKRRFKEGHHLKAVFLYRVQSLFGPVFATCRALQGNAVHLEKRVPHACWIFGIPFPSLGPKGSTQRQSDNFKRSWFVNQHAHACILCADLSWQKLRDARK